MNNSWLDLSNIERKEKDGVLFRFRMPFFTKALSDNDMLRSKDIAVIFKISPTEAVTYHEQKGHIPKHDDTLGSHIKLWNVGKLRKLEKANKRTN